MDRIKRIFALFSVVILVGLYITTFICGIIKSELSHYLFITSLLLTFLLPILLYVLLMFSKLAKRKEEINDSKNE